MLILLLDESSPQQTKEDLINRVSLEIEIAKRRRNSTHSIRSRKRERAIVISKQLNKTDRPNDSFEK